ncbi:AmpG family muropeptide MFS transporter [Variovorax sp. J22G73]|uniref:AmpG family muropeptide MFS transporter n=1 Tax=unclassified Variovorax TaxID=663243 RepID=UPI000D5CBEA6|nr:MULTISPECIES: MFS transporter [unclassified Variovorax]MDM0007543.1 AmpG family muropeptide MFS transporter [Variovorax sp. J22R203]MDM0100097.1 AmpG family muropeptide MFS transporter [Variovorax sp. J22G73]
MDNPGLMSATPAETPTPPPTPSQPSPPWRDALKVYLEPATLRMLALGFSAGLPLLLVLGTLSFRLREAGIDRATIGYLSWVGLAYGFKWVWAPLVDRLPLPPLTTLLGRRRGWLLLAQGMVIAGLVGMAMNDPRLGLTPLIWCALLVAFGSATQDIALDAFRIESAETRKQAALAAAYQTGYRLAMIWAGAGVLWVAAWAEVAPAAASAAVTGAAAYQNGAWKTAYLVMAASMAVGVLTVLLSPEPVRRVLPQAKNAAEWLQGALIEPFADFIRRYKWQAVLILSLIAIYRISDVVMGIMANPFYVDMGFTKDEVATVSKIYGVVMTLAGAFVGGVLSMRLGVMRVLMLGAVLSAASNLLFAWLASRGHDLTALIAVVSADNLAGGIASAAFIAYLSSLTNISYSATQYALFSSLMLLLPKFIAGYSGVFVDAYGYSTFFTATALLGVPVLVLVALASRLTTTARPQSAQSPAGPPAGQTADSAERA